LLWLLKDARVASTLPNIYDEKQLTEFASISECPDLTDDEMERVEALYAAHFGIEEERPKFKGTMESGVQELQEFRSSGASTG
jgi:hypothetical protein